MKLVILDGFACNEGDLDWNGLRALVDEVVLYPRTKYEDIIPRLQGADFAVVNKTYIDEAVLNAVPTLRWIGVTATGTDSLDVAACRRHGVPVANVPGYSTHSVAQHTFALLLDICQCPARHEAALREGFWQMQVPARFGLTKQTELFGKTFGVIGYGDIGRQTAKLAAAFGMRVLCHTRTVRPAYENDGVSFVSFAQLLRECDVISLHCPATEATRGLICEETLRQMKPSAILLNTARGALVNEQDVADALSRGALYAYGADVFAHEPLPSESPLLSAPNAFLTPHIAWATSDALSRLSAEVCKNLASFLEDIPKNIVN